MKWDSQCLVVISLIALKLIFTEVACAEIGDYTPKPKITNVTAEEVAVGPNSVVDIDSTVSKSFPSAIASLTGNLNTLPLSKHNVPIKIYVLTGAKKIDDIPLKNRSEGYEIEISASGVEVTSAGKLGALHGITTLEKLIREGNGRVRSGRIIDWPDHKIRALHLVVRYTRPEDIKLLIQYARFGHYNTLILMIDDWVRFPSMESIAPKSAWTRDEFLDVVNYARGNGLEVIPEVKLLTHQERLLKKTYPALMYNDTTYDPSKEGVYDVVFLILDDIISLLHPKAIHIGHDEVAGYDYWSKENTPVKKEKLLPADLYLQDVTRLHSYLKTRGIETWMWGDMLISPEEFPTMLYKHLNGTNKYSAIREHIPKDIVICDWHYFDGQPEFPSARAFVADGHTVLGATWRTEKTTGNFSRYIAAMPGGGDGMIATTWYSQPKDREILKKIIKTSSEAFWNAR